MVDANIIHGVSLEAKDAEHLLSASPSAVLDVLVTSGVPVCADEAGVIEGEWRDCCDPDWIDNWFLTFVSLANFQVLPTSPQPFLLKRLQLDCGFPKSRDRVLVITSIAASTHFGRCMLLTEDMDFYEPADKVTPPARRAKYMRGELKGRVKRHLDASVNVDVESVVLATSALQGPRRVP